MPIDKLFSSSFFSFYPKYRRCGANVALCGELNVSLKNKVRGSGLEAASHIGADPGCRLTDDTHASLLCHCNGGGDPITAQRRTRVLANAAIPDVYGGLCSDTGSKGGSTVAPLDVGQEVLAERKDEAAAILSDGGRELAINS